MKKLLAIVVLGLLLSGNVYAASSGDSGKNIIIIVVGVWIVITQIYSRFMYKSFH